MAWSKIQDNSRRASTGASMSSFVRRIGSSRTMFSRSVALEKSPPNSALLTRRSCSGYASMAFSAGQFQRLAKSNIGRLSAPTIRCGISWANSTQTGGVASLPSARLSMQAKIGSLLAAKSGGATRQHASGAALFTTKTQAYPFTSITSHPSRSRRCEQRRRTCCLFASLVTNGFIQEGM